MPAVSLTAVADAIPEKARQFAAAWEIPRTYADIEQMFETERPDFVDLVVGPSSHPALTRLASGYGISIICQKPMAPEIEDCHEMVRICAERGVRLMIHENWRWQPWFRETRRLLEAGLFGEPFYAGYCMRSGDGWGPTPYPVQPYFRSMERLLVYEMVVHFLDTFRYLMGEIVSVLCRQRQLNPAIRGEDCMLAQLMFENGASGLIDANRFTGAPYPAATTGDFTLEGDRARIRVTPAGDMFLTEYGTAERPFRLPEGSPSFAQGYKGDSVFAAQQHYVSCLRSGARSESEGDEYLKTVATVLACYESARTGQITRTGVSK
jgi:D-apiose dehydrogenase